MEEIEFKRFAPESHRHLIAEITALLHSAYAALASQGLHFVASHQSVAFTEQWLKTGETYLAFFADQLIGTVTLIPPKADSRADWFRRDSVYTFHKFAISPKLQGRGIGSQLLEMIEAKARERGAIELALDTSEKADALIAMYEKRGYRFIENVQWDEVNYRSVVMSKLLRE